MRNYIVCKSLENAKRIAEHLLEEDYIVMLSKEEEFYRLEFLWAPEGDRNYVVFRTVDEDEELFDNAIDDFMNELREQGKLK